MAERFLRWQYEKHDRPIPEAAELERQSQALVDEARRIAQRTGKNVIAIIKDMIAEFKK